MILVAAFFETICVSLIVFFCLVSSIGLTMRKN